MKLSEAPNTTFEKRDEYMSVNENFTFMHYFNEVTAFNPHFFKNIEAHLMNLIDLMKLALYR